MPKISDKLEDHLVSTITAVERHKYFLERQRSVIEKSLCINETQSVWYPLKVIKDYVAYLEQLNALHGSSIDGIRFYFSAYERGEEGLDEYKNRLSFIAMPTSPTKLTLQERKVKYGEGSEEFDYYKNDTVYFKEVGGVSKAIPINVAAPPDDLVNNDTALGGGGPFPPPPRN